MDIIKCFISLIRLGIGHVVSEQPTQFDWESIYALASKQGLAAVIIDGLERLPESVRPPKERLLEWIGEVLQGYDHRYELYRRTIAEMAYFYNKYGFKMMVLKGYACCLDWPKPEHRPCGDIDIWLFGEQKKADALLFTEKNLQVDDSHHHHTVFYWRDFMVENHYDFINVHHHKSNAEFEKILKEFGQNDSYSTEIYEEKVYLPSPNLHALFLQRHAVIEFAATGINLRQLLDWGFFVNAHSNEIDWEWIMNVLDRFGMTRIFNIFNAICVEDLGFEPSLFPAIQYFPYLKDKVLLDIISPQFSSHMPKGLIKRVTYKFRRWRASGWKHQLCYNESMMSAFWSGVKSHLLKPSSI